MRPVCRSQTWVVRPSGLATCAISWQVPPVPKVFEKDGFLFFFYSNEHRPIQVHVRRGSGEAVFEVAHGVELRESQGLKIKDLAKAEALASEHRELIITKWHEHLVR
ncbi:MAG: DUF4160 domain-containing protein [Verrucomicrobiae bacterium]|nr:DUF4160 domain-containing protein [Verrucomicrobiae bacterium]